MKTYKLILAALAALTFVGCTSDEFKGLDEAQGEQQSPIVFNVGGASVTRADLVGAQAAAVMDNMFQVYSTIDVSGTSYAEFDNYVVKYNGLIGTDDTNTRGWTYLDNLVSKGDNPAYQTIKYWNFSASKYDFVAFAGLPDDYKISSTERNTISVDATNRDKIYIADRVTATKGASMTGTTQNATFSNKPVVLTFKRIQGRIRLGMYETVPGYAVKDVRFYYDDNYLAQAGTSTKTIAGLRGTFPTAGTYDITYDANNDVVATFTSGTTANNFQFGPLDYTTATSSLVAGGNLNADGTVGTTGDAVFLSTSSALPTFAKKDAVFDGQTISNSDWQSLLPQPDNTMNLVLRVDFTLVSLDGVGLPIQVKGASAVVPVEWAKWKPNCAYTYIFKISDRTNGTTGAGDPNPSDPDDPNPDPDPTDPDNPSGLYAITFDAVVSSVEEQSQETISGITGLGGDAITTYSATSDVTNANEYKVGETITVSSVSKGRWSVAYSADVVTEAQVRANNSYTYTTLAGAATSGQTIDQNAVTSAQFNVVQAGYYIVWLRYLPTGKADIDGNYADSFKVVKTVN